MEPVDQAVNKRVTLAPGKLILAGEHAVVYGQPALVMAINRYVRCSLELVSTQAVTLAFNGRKLVLPSGGLRSLQRELVGRYRGFLAGVLGIKEVLRRPENYFLYALTQGLGPALEGDRQGYNLDITTEIPLGCGMGSSAAIAVAIILAASAVTGQDLSKDEVFKLAWETEKLQHGNPSGVDPYASLYGGWVKFSRAGSASLLWNNKDFQPWLAFTGVPATGTGECVAQVAKNFGRSSIWSEFGAVVEALAEALAAGKDEPLREAMRANHRLLAKIGVVPAKVQHFIREIEKAGGAAKVCGAGSVAGDGAGMVLLLAPPEEQASLGQKYGYALSQVSPALGGAGLV